MGHIQQVLNHAKVDNPDGLMIAVATVVLRRGGQRAFARESGVSQATLSRICNCLSDYLHVDVVERLRKYVLAIDDYVIVPDAGELLERQKTWLLLMLEDDPYYDAEWFDGLLEQMRRMLPRRCEAFDAECAKRGHDPRRVRLAFVRMARPFLVGLFGLERRWEELSWTERRDYVRSALNCERILLRRQSGKERAAYLAAHPELAQG